MITLHYFPGNASVTPHVLLREIGVPNPQGPRWKLMEMAIGHIAQPGHPPIIIDEADQAIAKGFIETIRGLHEATKVPILLIGEAVAKVPGVKLKFDRPFVKEFALSVTGDVPKLLKDLRGRGYHAGLHLGRWYPTMTDGLTVAVTEKRTKAEIDGLAGVIKGIVGK